MTAAGGIVDGGAIEAADHPGQRLLEAVGHADELFGYLRRRVGDPDTAADLHQETYLHLARAAPGRIANLRAYMFGIARNLLNDHHAHAARARHFVPLESANENIACDAPSAEQQAAAASDLEALKEALADLPVKQRSALLWYRLEGLPCHEIGRRLGVSESMAARYVKQALRHCQLRLER